MPPLKKPRPKFLKRPGAQAKLDKPHHPGKPDLDKRKERKPEKKPQKLVELHPLEHRHGRAARRDVYILGVAMSRHDRAACLLKNGQVVGAIGEERLDRRRRSLGSYQSYPRGLVVPPLAAITYLLRLAGISWDRVDLCVCGRSMTLCREALLERVPFPADRVVEPPLPGHHLAHAYSAYGTAPFANCAVLVIDEQGHHIDGAFEKCTWYEGATGPLTLVDRFFGGGDDLNSRDVVQRVCGDDEFDRGRQSRGRKADGTSRPWEDRTQSGRSSCPWTARAGTLWCRCDVSTSSWHSRDCQGVRRSTRPPCGNWRTFRSTCPFDGTRNWRPTSRARRRKSSNEPCCISPRPSAGDLRPTRCVTRAASP